MNDRIHNQAGDQRPVGVGPDYRLLDDLLNDHYQFPSGEGAFLLYAQQSPQVRVARLIRPLGMDDRHVGIDGRDDSNPLTILIRALNKPDSLVDAWHIRPGVTADRKSV